MVLALALAAAAAPPKTRHPPGPQPRLASALTRQVALLPLRPRLTIWVGAGPSIPTPTVGFRRVLMASVQMGYPMHPFGGRLPGHWDYEMELPVLLVSQHPTALAVSASPIGFRYTGRAGHRLRPFVGGMAGVVYSSEPVPSRASRLNFSPQAEFGFDWGRRQDRGWSAAIRYIHISNAGLNHPNPGLNSLLFIVGYSFR